MLTLDKLLIEQDDFRLCADLTLKQGSCTAILGPSGAGKSTLLTTLAGFLNPTSGRLLWDGEDIMAMAPGLRPLSILFQDQNLFPHLSVAQNLGLGISPRPRLSATDHARIAKALDRVGLSGMGARKPGSLSGGQQGRVALARCLLRAKPLLLLDEPFAALGPALKADMLALVAEIADEQGTTVIMVSHDPNDAKALCSETVLLADGVAQPPRPTDDLLADPPPALAAYLGR
ncbi:thiamine transport system ATP-binding protein [Rhodobacter aestuarii]|uniref:Thiamine transport system ATP-binding protein n=1 Tax=Rhodobacter aestuarii TaxID=453582 RepID=A0A1N7MQ67_9RHOB|nr:ATP-binding cassette domain-containing protein [Rhodobacter aestuarii]PTV96614.1 thiamine transport system ATP-binding protein [Rhodobacter aestuarii]SIS88200.1 thiamine transport system ATP-binding protein [Rhodobacter aestuarii]